MGLGNVCIRPMDGRSLLFEKDGMCKNCIIGRILDGRLIPLLSKAENAQLS